MHAHKPLRRLATIYAFLQLPFDPPHRTGPAAVSTVSRQQLPGRTFTVGDLWQMQWPWQYRFVESHPPNSWLPKEGSGQSKVVAPRPERGATAVIVARPLYGLPLSLCLQTTREHVSPDVFTYLHNIVQVSFHQHNHMHLNCGGVELRPRVPTKSWHDCLLLCH